MKKPQVGLVIEGNSTSSTLLRLPGFAAELGPIKARGLHVARRVSNFLKGGYPVHSHSDLESARTILIRAPDKFIGRTIEEISRADLNWSEHFFVLCETWAPTNVLQPLMSLGASVASLVQLPTARSITFAIEGDVGAVRQVKRLIERSDTHALEFRSNSKHLIFAAAVLCSAIPIPVLLMAQQALRDGGVSGNHLAALVEEMSSDMLMEFLKGARAKWGGPFASFPEANQQVYRNKLAETHPELSQTLDTLLECCKNFMIGR